MPAGLLTPRKFQLLVSDTSVLNLLTHWKNERGIWNTNLWFTFNCQVSFSSTALMKNLHSEMILKLTRQACRNILSLTGCLLLTHTLAVLHAGFYTQVGALGLQQPGSGGGLQEHLIWKSLHYQWNSESTPSIHHSTQEVILCFPKHGKVQLQWGWDDYHHVHLSAILQRLPRIRKNKNMLWTSLQVSLPVSTPLLQTQLPRAKYMGSSQRQQMK